MINFCQAFKPNCIDLRKFKLYYGRNSIKQKIAQCQTNNIKLGNTCPSKVPV